jgi:hypothetical protein
MTTAILSISAAVTLVGVQRAQDLEGRAIAKAVIPKIGLAAGLLTRLAVQGRAPTLRLKAL